MTGGLVVLSMRDLPGKVWHEESRVAEEADRIVQDLAGGERLMSTFMGHHPQSSPKQTLHKGVHKPETSSYRRVWNILRSKKTIEEVESDSQGGNVSSHIVQTGGSRPF